MERNSDKFFDSAIKLKDLHLKVIDWGYEKGIIQANNPMRQWTKTQEEVLELKEAIENNDKEAISDAIFDTIVTLILQAEIQNIDFEEGLEKVYNIISKRTGKIVNGVFVKDK